MYNIYFIKNDNLRNITLYSDVLLKIKIDNVYNLIEISNKNYSFIPLKLAPSINLF